MRLAARLAQSGEMEGPSAFCCRPLDRRDDDVRRQRVHGCVMSDRGRSAGWLVGFTAVLTVGMAVATIAQFVFGALAPFIREELAISRIELGALTTVLFVGGAVLSPLVGPLTDRVGGRRVLVVLFALNGLAFVAMAVAPSYILLLAAVAVSGIAIAGSNPSTNLLIAHHVPAGSRGAVVGFKQSGVQVGSFVAGAAFPSLAAVVGWRWSLVSVSATAVLGAALVVLFVPSDPPGELGRQVGFRVVTAVRWLVPYALFMGAGIAAITAYLVLYAHEAVGLDEPMAGTLLAVMGGVGVVARIAWSHHASRRRTISVLLAWLAGLALVSTAAVLMATWFGAWWLWVGAVGAGSSAAAWNGVGMLAVIRQAGPRGAGQASGVVLTAFYVGLLVMPIGFGAIVDTTGAYVSAWGLTAGCFTLALVTAILWAHRERIRRESDWHRKVTI